MHRKRTISGREGEQGVVILLVAIVLLFVVGAMAVLAIDLVTFYTARSEAQLAADGAALAGARALANSGATSNPTDVALVANAESLATTVATQVALQNKVGGRNLKPAEVPPPVFQGSLVGAGSNPQITVRVTRDDLPTFFARIWGRTQISVSATATAEAYNPSGLTSSVSSGPPIAPVCVKPWVLPNKNPNGGSDIFNPITGAIEPTALPLLGSDVANFQSRCTTNCGLPIEWQYYPGDPSSFPPPIQASNCKVVLNPPYQTSIAGCVLTPIACNSIVKLDISSQPNRNSDTAQAVNCLTHSENDNGDRVSVRPPNRSFQFVGGADNPVAAAIGKNVMVSDSLVTVPVFDSSVAWPPPGSPPSVQVIGFVQLFLNPDGEAAESSGQIKTTVVNLVGCGTTATGQPILGNGASAVPVRLISR